MEIFLIIVFAICGLVAYFALSGEKSKLEFKTPEEKPDTIQDQAQPGQGILSNIGTRIQAGSDLKTQTLVNEYTSAANTGIRLGKEALEASFEKEATLPRHHEERERERAAHETFLIQQRTQQKEHLLREKLVDIATALGYDVDTYLLQQRNNLDIEKIEQETMTKLKAGFVYQLQGYQKLTMLRTQLDALYDREFEIQNSNDDEDVKRKKLKQVKKDIQMLEKDANGRRAGLLQAYNGQEILGSHTDTEH